MGLYHDGIRLMIVPNGATYEVVSPYDGRNSLDFCIANPSIVVDDCTWNNDDSLWAEQKTIYDPCPAGWRIPDNNAWKDESIYPATSIPNYVILNNSDALYPSTGYIDCGYMNDINHIGYYWTLNCQAIRSHFSWATLDGATSYPEDWQMTVRCMKEAPKQSGDNEGYDENEDYEW